MFRFLRAQNTENAGQVWLFLLDLAQTEDQMKRIAARVLPNGELRNVQPFHVSMKGLEKVVLCRDEEDYGVMVKYTAICARRKNVLIIIYAVVSNHCHVAVLAQFQKDANAFAQELKRVYAQWFSAKYQESGILRGVDVKAVCLDNDWHVRNALAYIPRNALDNGCPVHKYQWSGYKAMFSGETAYPGSRRVAALTKRELGSVMHTRDKLSDVPWLLDKNNQLIPGSICDKEYLEQVFHHDPAFWLKTIGALNSAEMEEKLVEAPRRMLPDSEFYKVVADTADRWFSQGIPDLPLEKKLRLVPFLWRSRKTTVNQLARALGLDRDLVKKALLLPRSSD